MASLWWILTRSLFYPTDIDLLFEPDLVWLRTAGGDLLKGLAMNLPGDLLFEQGTPQCRRESIAMRERDRDFLRLTDFFFFCFGTEICDESAAARALLMTSSLRRRGFCEMTLR